MRSPEIRRVESLDLLRGLAALTVVLHHLLLTHQLFWDAYNYKSVPGYIQILAYSPLHLFWGGHEAVLIFFVLSGYVLSLPYWCGKKIDYLPFVVKRFFRLYPAYIVASMVTIAALALVGGGYVPGASTWSNAYWQHPPTIAQIRDYLLMWGDPSLNTINPVIWTLVVEMQISLIFPFLVFFMRKIGFLSTPLVMTLPLVAHFLPPLPGLLNETIGYCWLFVMGAEIARRDIPVSRYWIFVLIIAALLLLNARWALPGIHFSKALTLATSLGAGLMVWALSSLELRFGKWLGEMSYGIYLWHCGVVFFFLHALGSLPIGLQLAIDFSATFVLAYLLYRFVELPFMRFGAFLANRLRSARNAYALP